MGKIEQPYKIGICFSAVAYSRRASWSSCDGIITSMTAQFRSWFTRYPQSTEGGGASERQCFILHQTVSV